MAELSPAAKAVLDAFLRAPCDDKLLVAAALRAAVDQAFPLTRTPWGSTLVPVFTAHESRDRLLAIATELENQ
jgi:hypothetical protein